MQMQSNSFSHYCTSYFDFLLIGLLYLDVSGISCLYTVSVKIFPLQRHKNSCMCKSMIDTEKDKSCFKRIHLWSVSCGHV